MREGRVSGPGESEPGLGRGRSKSESDAGGAAGLSVDVVDHDGGVTLRLGGEIDLGNVARVRARLLELSHGEAGTVRVDLADVTFLDSTAIGVLIQARKRFTAEGTSFHLVAASDRVRRTFEVAGVGKYLDGS
jgi:anti-sigma B factor antagonist